MYVIAIFVKQFLDNGKLFLSIAAICAEKKYQRRLFLVRHIMCYQVEISDLKSGASVSDFNDVTRICSAIVLTSCKDHHE